MKSLNAGLNSIFKKSIFCPNIGETPIYLYFLSSRLRGKEFLKPVEGEFDYISQFSLWNCQAGWRNVYPGVKAVRSAVKDMDSKALKGLWKRLRYAVA